jgi:cobalt-zinc-cadmium efflux system outer membrane protein
MTRHVFTWGLIIAFACGLAPRRAHAQAPTIEMVPSTPTPGSTESRLGPIPGAGGGPFGLEPGAGGAVLGGRPGTSTPRVPTTIANPAAAGPTLPPLGIAAPVVPPITAQPIYGRLSLPSQVADEGPPDGLTLDMAIDRMLRENLDLRSKYFEIPQAQADILQAGLRANPLFYADGQLVPYGNYSKARPGGPTQYDVNVSHPFDLSHKRQARTQVATQAKRVLEAQYQEAVRLAINNLYTAYIDVLAARQTVRYAKESLRTLERVRAVTQKLYERDVTTRPDLDRVKIAQEGTYIGVLDAEESLLQKKRALGVLLNLAPAEAESLELRGTILDKGPPPPPSEVLQQIALAVRPDIVAYRLGVQRAVADVRLAQANRFSDVYVLYQPYTFQDNTPFDAKSAHSWALGVTVPMPLYNRNQGGILRAKLNVTQTQIELANLERQARIEVLMAEREYAITRQAIERIEKNLLPTATQMRDDTYRLYVGGEVNVVAFLNTESEYNTRVKQYLDTLVRHRRSMLALNTALGQRLLP